MPKSSRSLGAFAAGTHRAVLRRLWGQYGVDEAILMVLARQPLEEDRERFRRRTRLRASRFGVALSGRPGEITADLGGASHEAMSFSLFCSALRRLPDGKETDKVRNRLLAYLTRRTGRKATTVPEWLDWYGRTYPERADPAERCRWRGYGGVEQTVGSPRLVGRRRGTRPAHLQQGELLLVSFGNASAAGSDPRRDRTGSRDLFTAIVQPSKDVSPRYRTTQITTADGKVYQGLIVYEAVDSVILQTGPNTIRLTNPQIRANRRPTTTSLMPAGLLDKLSDRDLADLYAYLKSLVAP